MATGTDDGSLNVSLPVETDVLGQEGGVRGRALGR